MIHISKFWESEQAEIITSSGKESFKVDLMGEGYQFNVIANDILVGKTQNKFITHEYTLEIMRQMDSIRKFTRLRYPQEQ